MRPNGAAARRMDFNIFSSSGAVGLIPIARILPQRF